MGYHAAFWFAIAFSLIGLVLALFVTSGNGIHLKIDKSANKGGEK